jgi:hypothetical protein
MEAKQTDAVHEKIPDNAKRPMSHEQSCVSSQHWLIDANLLERRSNMRIHQLLCACAESATAAVRCRAKPSCGAAEGAIVCVAGRLEPTPTFLPLHQLSVFGQVEILMGGSNRKAGINVNNNMSAQPMKGVMGC